MLKHMEHLESSAFILAKIIPIHVCPHKFRWFNKAKWSHTFTFIENRNLETPRNPIAVYHSNRSSCMHSEHVHIFMRDA